MSISEYIHSKSGQLKIAEMVLSLAGFISAMMAEVLLTPTGGIAVYVFTVLALVFSFTVFVLNTVAVKSRPRKCPAIVMPLTFLLTLLLLVAGVMAALRAYQFTLILQMFLPMFLSYAYATIACACFVMADCVVFAIDSCYSYSEWKSWSRSNGNASSIEPAFQMGTAPPGVGWSQPKEAPV